MDPYPEACQALEGRGVPYLVVGAFGINLYAQDVGSIISTVDCDILLPAVVDACRPALQALQAAGFAFEAGGDPLPEVDTAILEGLVRARANVVARKQEARIDLALKIAACEFEDLWPRQRRFEVDGVILRVAPLADLVASKEAANRPKDRVFLATYRALLDEMIRRDAT